MKQRLTGIFLAFGGVALAGVVIAMIPQAKPSNPPAAVTQPSAQTGLEAPDPLTIQAMRARQYQSSPIVVTQELGEQGGFHNSIISFQSDGLTEYALMATPDSARPAGGWPVIILDHGYIDPALYQTNGPEYRQFIATFASAGFMVVKPDYRGHGKSQGQPEGGHFSPVYAYDNLNLIETLKAYQAVDPSRIGLLGHSLGGHVALRTIVVSKDVKATAFMAGVVGSFNDIFYNWPNSPAPNDRPTPLVQDHTRAVIEKYGDPKSNPAFWDSISAINYVDAVTGKVQVNQDVDDSVVPKLFSDHLVAALQKAGKSVEYDTYPGNDHQFSANRTAILRNLLAFYKANL